MCLLESRLNLILVDLLLVTHTYVVSQEVIQEVRQDCQPLKCNSNY